MIGTIAIAETPDATPRNGAMERTWLSRITFPVLPIVLVAFFGLIATWHYDAALRGQRESFVQAQGVILVTQRVAILEETAEAAERSFALTGDASLLESFFPALEALPATAQRLEALVAADPVQADRAATVSDLVGVRTRQMWEAVEARRRYGLRAARSAVQNPQSRETDRRLTEALDAMAGAERAVLAERQASVDRLERSLLLVGLAIGALTLIIHGARRMLRRRAMLPAEA